jgi:hypothetical protein
MNAKMITPGKVNKVITIEDCKEMNSVNSKLVELSQILYKKELTFEQINKICAMSYLDKLWLIAQYRVDLRIDSLPDLSNL